MAVNYPEGVKWLEKAADAGDAQALGNLGACYFNGFGVERNTEKGVSLIRKAAKAGNEEAQKALQRISHL